jgi:HAD domain family 1 in Swiss Army Knife RNA repair proteins
MKKLAVYDFDGTLMNSPHPEEGKKIWKDKTGEDYPNIGWWSKPESLNTDVFDIKPIPSIHSLLQKDVKDIDTYVIILTNRIFKLRPELENILKLNNIVVDGLITKSGKRTKDDVIKSFLEKYPTIKTIDVYDDMKENIDDYKSIRPNLDNDVKLNIYNITDGKISLVETNNKLLRIINEVLISLIN